MNEAEKHEHAIVNDDLHHLSVTQIQKFRLCERKWGWDKIDHVPEREFKSQGIGRKGHTEIDNYLKTGDDGLGLIAASGKHLLPPPKDPGVWSESKVEEWVDLRAAGVPVIGAIDIVDARSPGWLVISDHKFVGSIDDMSQKYGFKPDDLITFDTDFGLQLGVYQRALWLSGRFADRRMVRLGLNLFQTKGAKRAEYVFRNLPFNGRDLEWATVVEPLAQRMRLAARARTGRDLKPNDRACRKYGGCSFEPQCFMTQFGSTTTTGGSILSLLDAFKPGTITQPPTAGSPWTATAAAAPAGATATASTPAPTPPDAVPPTTFPAAVPIAPTVTTFPAYGPGANAPITGAALEHLNGYRDNAVRLLAEPSAVAIHDQQRGLLAAIDAELTRQRTPGATPPPAPAPVVNPPAAVTASPPVVPPDAPASNPTLAAVDPTVAPPASSPPSSPAEAPKRGRGRPPKNASAAAPVAAPVSSPTAADTSADALIVYVDAVPNMPAAPLNGYVAAMAERVRLASNPRPLDIRSATDKPLAFGGWKGILVAAVRAEPPPPGVYVLITAGNDLALAVAEALEPICAPGNFARGVR